jgi:hypothetical protein
MSDTQQKGTDPHSTTPIEDEDIIDLLEEIPRENPQPLISPLEDNLLDIELAADRGLDDLPDINDLIRLDIDGADLAEDTTGSLRLSQPGPAASPIAHEGAPGPAALENEIEEIPGLDEQIAEDNDAHDIESILAGPALVTKEKQAVPEENEILELIEVDEEENDDEIVWFDDLDKEITLPETLNEIGPPETDIEDLSAESDPEVSTPDFISADSRISPPGPSFSPGIGAALAGAGAAAATVAAWKTPVSSPVGASPPAEPIAPPPAAFALTEAEIEAAVERVIERKLGHSVQSVIREAIENAVSKEIERLKRLLLEDDNPGAAP